MSNTPLEFVFDRDQKHYNDTKSFFFLMRDDCCCGVMDHMMLRYTLYVKIKVYLKLKNLNMRNIYYGSTLSYIDPTNMYNELKSHFHSYDS